jgi:hypothetical protein
MTPRDPTSIVSYKENEIIKFTILFLTNKRFHFLDINLTKSWFGPAFKFCQADILLFSWESAILTTQN